MAPDDGSPLPSRPFTGWRKLSNPDPEAAAELYRSGMTQKEIARRLGVSPQRVVEALAAAGVKRRESGRACPVGAVELRRLVAEGKKQHELSAMFAASSGTVGRWLAEAGIGKPDPRIDHRRLRELYVVDALTVREVAERFGVPHHRVIRELALAGIPRRSRHERRPRGARAAVTDEALRELYVERGLTIRESLRRVPRERRVRAEAAPSVPAREAAGFRSWGGTATRSPPTRRSCTKLGTACVR